MCLFMLHARISRLYATCYSHEFTAEQNGTVRIHASVQVYTIREHYVFGRTLQCSCMLHRVTSTYLNFTFGFMELIVTFTQYLTAFTREFVV